MAHDHAAHADGDGRRLTAALALILTFMAVEVTAGVVAHSLALLSDAGHMLTDAGAIGFSLLALRLAARPAAGAMTFGFRRVEILSAQANGVTLLILAAFITYEAIHRLFTPPHVRALPILIVALAGILVNVAVIWTLSKANRRSLNIEGSFQHVLTDLYGFIATALAAGIILLTGFQRADPLVSLVIAGLMIRSGYSLVKASGRIFLEAAPEGLDPQAIGRALVGPGRASSRFTTCTCGRWAAGFRRSRRMFSWPPTVTAMRRAVPWRRCCTSASDSTTRPCRLITAVASY